MEYYVLMVKVATGANRYLVVREDHQGILVIWNTWDHEADALAEVEHRTRETT